MTWNSSCSIASDDENSRQSFLSDCGSEFDLSPPPRYPAEKRAYAPSNKQSINRAEPPLTRSRAKATGKSLILSEPLSKSRRQSTLRRSMDAFTGMATTLTSSLSNNSILFPKQEPSTPLDGVNVLADRFESCSLDEGRLNKNCLWSSRETNSHYTRPIPPPSFGASPVFLPPSNTTFFGQQQQAQLWSRFRYAASTLRNDLWHDQTDLNLQQVPSNLFASNYSSFTFDQPAMLLPPQTSPPLFRQRKTTSIPESTPTTTTEKDLVTQSSSKIFFALAIFAIGLVLGCLLTNTFPPGFIWEICAKYFHILYGYLQTIIQSYASFRSA